MSSRRPMTDLSKTTAKRKSNPLLPALGLALALITGIFAWFYAFEILGFVEGLIPGFTGTELPRETMRIIVVVVLTLLVLAIFGLIAAIVTPKEASSASEAALDREREAARARAKAERDSARRRGR